MCNSRGLLCLPSPANTSRSGREIRLAPNQICYQIVQFLDLVNVCLARNGPVWAQRGGADEVTENQSMYSLIHTQTRKLTPCLYLFFWHTHRWCEKKLSVSCVHSLHTHAALCLHCKLYPSSISQHCGFFFCVLHIILLNFSAVCESGCCNFWAKRWDLWFIWSYPAATEQTEALHLTLLVRVL